MGSKNCNRCKEDKLSKDFSKDRSKKDGLRTICRECSKKTLGIPKPRNPEFGVLEVIKDGVVTKVKKCSKCLTSKELTEYNKAKHCVGGVTSHCKKCLGSKGLYRHAKIVKIKEGGVIVEAKDCGKCLVVKPLTSFTVINSQSKGVGGRYSTCMDCEREYRQKLMEDEGRKLRRFRTRREYESTYQGRRRELYRINIKKERERGKIKDANRIALASKLRNDLTSTDYDVVLSRFKDGCALTEEQGNVSLDHFIPLWTGHGGTYVGNVYPLKDSLNYAKRNTNPFLWGKKHSSEGDFEEVKFNELVAYLSEENEMSEEDFRKFVYWCFENRRIPDDIPKDGPTSLNLFKTSKESHNCR